VEAITQRIKEEPTNISLCDQCLFFRVELRKSKDGKVVGILWSKEDLERMRRYVTGYFDYDPVIKKLLEEEEKRIEEVRLRGYRWLCPKCPTLFESLSHMQMLQFIFEHLRWHEAHKAHREYSRKKWYRVKDMGLREMTYEILAWLMRRGRP